jgi:hypothetical protein
LLFSLSGNPESVLKLWDEKSFLFKVVCLATPESLPTERAFYYKCAYCVESVGDIAKRISDL